MKYPELSCNVYAEVDGENVLLIEIDREGRAKVIDFGAAKEYHSGKDNSILLKHGNIESYIKYFGTK